MSKLLNKTLKTHRKDGSEKKKLTKKRNKNQREQIVMSSYETDCVEDNSSESETDTTDPHHGKFKEPENKKPKSINKSFLFTQIQDRNKLSEVNRSVKEITDKYNILWNQCSYTSLSGKKETMDNMQSRMETLMHMNEERKTLQEQRRKIIKMLKERVQHMENNIDLLFCSHRPKEGKDLYEEMNKLIELINKETGNEVSTDVKKDSSGKQGEAEAIELEKKKKIKGDLENQMIEHAMKGKQVEVNKEKKVEGYSNKNAYVP